MHFIGPTSDHTSGKGKYIFIEASSPRKVNDTAVIASPTVNSDGDYCLTFWYHMYGPDVNTLRVSSQPLSGSSFTVFEKSGMLLIYISIPFDIY